MSQASSLTDTRIAGVASYPWRCAHDSPFVHPSMRRPSGSHRLAVESRLLSSTSPSRDQTPRRSDGFQARDSREFPTAGPGDFVGLEHVGNSALALVVSQRTAYDAAVATESGRKDFDNKARFAIFASMDDVRPVRVDSQDADL